MEALSVAPPPPLPTSTPLPTPGELVRGLGGFAWLGLAGTLGAGQASFVAAPFALVTAAGVLLLTVPALVVGHQYLRLGAAPPAIVGEIARVFARCGDVALATVPALLLFSMTSRLGGGIAALLLAALGLLGLRLAARRLVRLELDAAGHPVPMGLLVLAWSGLAALVGLRLTLHYLL